MLKKAGKAPKAVINVDANPTTVAGAILFPSGSSTAIYGQRNCVVYGNSFRINLHSLHKGSQERLICKKRSSSLCPLASSSSAATHGQSSSGR